MDPEVTLSELRQWAAQVMQQWDSANPELSDGECEAAERFQALDHWLSLGGAYPEDWS